MVENDEMTIADSNIAAFFGGPWVLGQRSFDSPSIARQSTATYNVGFVSPGPFPLRNISLRWLSLRWLSLLSE